MTSNAMKTFVLGVITALLIVGWVVLAITGVISVKTAIIIPIGIIIGIGLTLFLLGIWWWI